MIVEYETYILGSKNEFWAQILAIFHYIGLCCNEFQLDQHVSQQQPMNKHYVYNQDW